MNETIQKLLYSGKSEITLPSGEYQGRFVINSPCTVTGENTVLWNDNDTVLSITSPGVVLKNLKIELFNCASEDIYAVEANSDVKCENTEIIGRVSGFGEEDKFTVKGKLLRLGKFRSETVNTFLTELETAEPSELIHEIADLTIEPKILKAGKNKIRITTSSLASNTYIYGSLTVRSAFDRKYYISGMAADDAESSCDRIIDLISENSGKSKDLIRISLMDYQSASENITENKSGISEKRSDQQKRTVPPAYPVQMAAGNVAAKPVPQPVYQPQPVQNMILKRGERIYIDNPDSVFQIFMGYRNLKARMELDPYVFLLDETGVTQRDSDFIYFGNMSSGCGSVVMNRDKSIILDLKKVPDYVKRISFVYSIYSPGYSLNFTYVKDPFIRIVQNNKTKYYLELNDMTSETTLIFTEIYKYSNRWKISAVGYGFREGLKKLCSNYGLIVS